MKSCNLLIALLSMGIFSTSAFADVWVDSYTRKNGTEVQGHYRSNADGNRSNNWTTQGNTNPHTGERGHKQPDGGSWGQSNSYGTSPNSNGEGATYGSGRRVFP